MSVINTNITSMIGQSNLSKSQNALQTSMERLSSGLRINSAKDDAAGQAIANRMTSQITGLAQAQRNANDGISIAQTAEGGLNQINDNLQRIRELTVQAQNGTNSASDIDSIQQEVNERLEEIDRIARETDFNGSKVLSSDADSTISIQVGSQDGQTIDININANSGWNKFASEGDANFISKDALAQVGGESRSVDVRGFDVLDEGLTEVSVDTTSLTANNNSDGFVASIVRDENNQAFIENTATYTAANNIYGDIASGDTFTIEKGDADGSLYVNVTTDADASGMDGWYAIDRSAIQANGGLDLSGLTAADKLASAPSGTTTTVADTDALATDYYAIDESMVDSAGAVTADISTLTAETQAPTLGAAVSGTMDLDVTGGSKALEQLDQALAAVDSQRSSLGAIQNRFESAITNLQTNETNLSAARSRIEDADYAVEVADMTRAQILQQAGTSVLAQANQIPQNVLSLLG